MAGIIAFPEDHDQLLSEPAAFSFHVEFEKKLAERLSTITKEEGDKDSAETQYLLLERAVELLRACFTNIKPQACVSTLV